MSKLIGLSLLAGGLISMMFGAPPEVATSLFVADADGETVETHDLADLRDGETRTYGEGDHQITATRNGERVELVLPEGREGERARTVTCVLGKGTCQVFTSDDSTGARVMVMGGSGGDVTKDVNVIRLGKGGDSAFVWAGAGDEGAKTRTKVIRIGGDGPMLRCPEGDTSMHLEEGDDRVYFCPRHDIELEKVDHESVIENIIIRKGRSEAF